MVIRRAISPTVAVSLLLFCCPSVTASAQDVLAPSFVLEGVDGQKALIRPGQLKKILLVHIFSTKEKGWQEELLGLKAFYIKYKKKGLAAIAVAARAPGTKEELIQFAVTQRIEMPIGVDSQGGALEVFGGGEMPRVVLIGARGDEKMRSQKSLTSVIPSIQSLLPELFKERKLYVKEQKQLAKKQAREKKEIQNALKKVVAISSEELKAMLDSGQKFSLYFIGSRINFEKKHLPQAHLLGLDEVDTYFKDKDPNERIVLYCGCDRDEWGISGLVAGKLYLSGFKNTTYLKGHLQAWEAKNFPLEGRGESGEPK